MRKKISNLDEFISSTIPGSLLSRDEAIKRLMPEIEAMRLDLFGKKSPLFPIDQKKSTDKETIKRASLEAINKALAWIKRKSKREADAFVREVEKNEIEAAKLKDKIERLNENLSNLVHRKCSLEIESPALIPLPWENVLSVWPGTSLAALAEKTKLISETMNFTQAGLIMYVLTGIKPYQISYRISVNRSLDKSLGKIVGSSMRLEIFRELTFEEFMVLRRKQRSALLPREKFSAENYDLWKLIEDKGGPPLKGQMKFWAMIRDEWNRTHPGKEYSNVRSPRMAYFRIRKRLEPRKF